MGYSNLFADGFNNSSIDAAWTQAAGTWTEGASSIATTNNENEHILRLSTDYDLDEGRMYCDVYIGTEYSSDCRTGFYFNYKAGEASAFLSVFLNAANDKVYICQGTGFTEKANATVTINTGTWYRLGAEWKNSDGIVHAFVDGVEKCSYDFGAGFFDENKQISLYKKAVAGGNSRTYFKDFDLDDYVADVASNNYVYIL